MLIFQFLSYFWNSNATKFSVMLYVILPPFFGFLVSDFIKLRLKGFDQSFIVNHIHSLKIEIYKSFVFCSKAEENTILSPSIIKEKIKFIHSLKAYLHFT